MQLTFLALLFLLVHAETTVSPRYPPDAVTGGTVVSAVTSVNGAIENIELLYSDPPFASPVESALTRWRFESEGIRKTLVIVHFRYPQNYLLGPAKQEIPLKEHPKSLPYPKYIIQPAFPINVIGEASIVFYADITKRGTVSNIQIVRSSGNLTAGLDAVKRWEFLPALDESGIEIPSHAYIVIVFRPPSTAPKRED
jgi:TonB family protein